MHPILIEFGSITIYSYGFFVAAAFLMGLAIAAWQAKLNGLDYSLVPDLGFYLILGAIVGSRLLYVLIHPEYFWENPLYILQFWKGGLVFLGGVSSRVVLPLGKKGILSTFLLVWARAIGEFGATITLAGATPLKTTTIPIGIFLGFQSADIYRATVFILILIGISLLVLFISRLLLEEK